MDLFENVAYPKNCHFHSEKNDKPVDGIGYRKAVFRQTHFFF